MKIKVHVVPYSGGRWAVRRAGSQRVSSVCKTQSSAIDTARDIAKKEYGEMFIHNKEGRIRERNSYGNDPFPPKG